MHKLIAERWRCFYHFDKCALFVFLSGNRNIFRLFGGENSHTIQTTQQVPSNKTGSNKSCRNIQEYSSQMPSLGRFYRAHWEALSLDVLNFIKTIFFPHQGAVEGCCIGFTKFCASLLSSSDPELRDIPAQMLKKVSDGAFSGWKLYTDCWLLDWVFPLVSVYRDCRLFSVFVLHLWPGGLRGCLCWSCAFCLQRKRVKQDHC